MPDAPASLRDGDFRRTNYLTGRGTTLRIIRKRRWNFPFTSSYCGNEATALAAAAAPPQSSASSTGWIWREGETPRRKTLFQGLDATPSLHLAHALPSRRTGQHGGQAADHALSGTNRDAQRAGLQSRRCGTD